MKFYIDFLLAASCWEIDFSDTCHRYINFLKSMATSMDNDQAPFLTSSSQPIDMIEGDITSSSSNRMNQNELSTLDEPVFETIKRLYIL